MNLLDIAIAKADAARAKEEASAQVTAAARQGKLTLTTNVRCPECNKVMANATVNGLAAKVCEVPCRIALPDTAPVATKE